MKAEGWILRMVAPICGGPRKRSILEACAERHGGDARTVDRMIKARALVRYGDKRGATWGAPLPPRSRARGFGTVELVVYALVAIAIAGAFYAVYAWIDSSWETSAGIKKGEANKQALWDAANVKAQKEEFARKAAVGRALLASESARLAAEEKARVADDNWKEAQRENRRKNRSLVVCGDQPAAPEPESAVAGAAPSGPGIRARPADPGVAGPRGSVRFTWDFVRLHDGAWTGATGKPLFGDPAIGEAAAGPGAASPYTADDVLDVHGENARRCSADRREYRALIVKLEAAERAWSAAQPLH